ncbi:MAG: hypothetical protein HY521_03290 [Proteobacteria bacterium]|nr:hypothetical protein [Pseudomonadota bacterium]
MPSPLRTIRLELARTAEFPEGSSHRGYVLVAPLDPDGRIDLDTWRRQRRQCTVRRFWEGDDDDHGRLIRTRDRGWAFSYAPGTEDDENIHRLQEHVFRIGEYVSIRQHDGTVLPFRVVELS